MTKNALIAFSVGLDKSLFVIFRCLCNLILADQFFYRFLSKAILTLVLRRTQRIAFERDLLCISFSRQYQVLMLRQIYEKQLRKFGFNRNTFITFNMMLSFCLFKIYSSTMDKSLSIVGSPEGKITKSRRATVLHVMTSQ